MFDAKEIDFNTYDKEEELNDAFGAGRGYAVASGVAGAIKACIDEYYPGTEVKIDHVEGLAECKNAFTSKGRKEKRLSDRRNGMSGWMCSRSRYKYSSCKSRNSSEEICERSGKLCPTRNSTILNVKRKRKMYGRGIHFPFSMVGLAYFDI